LDFCLDQGNAVFINLFLQSRIYKTLIRYLTYENLEDEERFLLLYNKQTPDLEKFMDLYEFIVLCFVKWNNKFGVANKKKTPFEKNLKTLKKNNKNVQKILVYINQTENELGNLIRIFHKQRKVICLTG